MENNYYSIAIILCIIAFITLFPMLIYYKRKSEYLKRKDYYSKIFCEFIFNKYINDMNLTDDQVYDLIKSLNEQMEREI